MIGAQLFKRIPHIPLCPPIVVGEDNVDTANEARNREQDERLYEATFGHDVYKMLLVAPRDIKIRWPIAT